MNDIIVLLESKMESGELSPFFVVTKNEQVFDFGKRETKYFAMGYPQKIREYFSLKDGEFRVKIKRPNGHHVEILIIETKDEENQPFWED